MPGIRSAANDVDVDLGALFSSLARRWPRILFAALIITAIAFAFAWLATPKYKGETRILIETRESVFTQPDPASNANSPVLDEEGVISQVQVVSSTEVLKKVARQFDLASRDEFNDSAEIGPVGRLLVLAGLKSDPSEIPAEERVLQAMRDKLQVYRVEKSRVIVVDFSSADPKLAAAVPNAIAETYIAVQKDAKLESNSNATSWLAPEIKDLTTRVKDAEAKVADYRAHSDLFLSDNNSALITQQLSQMSTELSRVRADRAAAEAKALSVKAALAGGGSLDALPDVLSSGLIQRLREQQVQLKANIDQLSTTLLPNHPRIKALRSQLAGLGRQIRVETEKVLSGLNTEADTAKLREQQLLGDLNKAKAESSRAGQQEVELRALQREATAQRDLLQSYLTRYREASSRRDRDYLPVDARIFSRATVPAIPYFPKRIPIVVAAFIASLLIMAVVTLLQELFSGRAMRPARGAGFGPVEEVAMPNGPSRKDDPAFAPIAIPSADVEPVAIAGLAGVSIERAAEKLIAGGASRAIFVSPEGDEAAAASVMVAREVADAGLRVLLLDLTSSGAASTPMLESNSYPGVTNLLAAEAQFTDVIHIDLYSDCHVMPVGTADPERAMRAVDRLPIILNSLTTAYDVVVVECGPAEATSIRRLVSDGAEVLVSVIEPDDPNVGEMAAALEANGYGELMLVTPAGHLPPHPPVPDRSAA
ncbi:MAG: exopolysaccharide transport family protein [Hyphomicrobiales bacterium]|nr:exopolysaccharide transport family protein [Hyphomicrobiales bacterium]